MYKKLKRGLKTEHFRLKDSHLRRLSSHLNDIRSLPGGTNRLGVEAAFSLGLAFLKR